MHSLLLLADSALPLGSFAYSSGLESYLQHHKSRQTVASFDRFLRLSISSMASTSLIYMLAAYRYPENLELLDNDLDASTPCVVAQRASTAQGRALLGVWERSFRRAYSSNNNSAAIKALEDFSDSLKSSIGSSSVELGPKGHFAPLWGVVSLAMGIGIQQVAYVFMLNHVKALLSAAVRASVMGPYQAQSVLASRDLQEIIAQRIDQEWHTDVDSAGQVAPVIDLWIGRHELLYSRIFNS